MALRYLAEVGKGAAPRSRKVYFSGVEQETAIIDRIGLSVGSTTVGPAILEESTATTLVPPGWKADVIGGGHLSLTKMESAT